MSQFSASLRKEALLQWRMRSHFAAVFVFGAITLLLFSFATGPNATMLRQQAAGYLWMAILFCATLTLADSFSSETASRADEGLKLLPVSGRVFFYAKALVSTANLTLLGWSLLPLMIVLYDAGTVRVPMLMWVIALGSAALSAPGTLYAGMTSRARSGQLLLPLLLFPLVVPVLLASMKTTGLAINGDPMDQLRSWLILLVAFNALFWSLCGLLFEKVLED